jgi:hypothetical protein
MRVVHGNRLWFVQPVGVADDGSGRSLELPLDAAPAGEEVGHGDLA